MRIWVLLIMLFCTATYRLAAQKTSEEDYATNRSQNSVAKNQTSFRDRLVFGGNMGGYFGNPTYLQLNPMVGYRTSDWWINGVGVNYTYIASGSYRENMLGGSIWTRAYIAQRLIAQSEFELLRREARNQYGNTAAVNVPVWLVGAGYSSGGRIGFSAMIMYDLIQDPNSPYSNPIIRLGGLFGF